MRVAFTVLVAALAAGLALASPAEAGWKWKKMKWVPHHGQEYRAPYAHPGSGAPYGYGARGYGPPAGYARGYGHSPGGGFYGPNPYGPGYGTRPGW